MVDSAVNSYAFGWSSSAVAVVETTTAVTDPFIDQYEKKQTQSSIMNGCVNLEYYKYRQINRDSFYFVLSQWGRSNFSKMAQY